jgi:hypothetical protein
LSIWLLLVGVAVVLCHPEVIPLEEVGLVVLELELLLL